MLRSSLVTAVLVATLAVPAFGARPSRDEGSRPSGGSDRAARQQAARESARPARPQQETTRRQPNLSQERLQLPQANPRIGPTHVQGPGYRQARPQASDQPRAGRGYEQRLSERTSRVAVEQTRPSDRVIRQTPRPADAGNASLEARRQGDAGPRLQPTHRVETQTAQRREVGPRYEDGAFRRGDRPSNTAIDKGFMPAPRVEPAKDTAIGKGFMPPSAQAGDRLQRRDSGDRSDRAQGPRRPADDAKDANQPTDRLQGREPDDRSDRIRGPRRPDTDRPQSDRGPVDRLQRRDPNAPRGDSVYGPRIRDEAAVTVERESVRRVTIDRPTRPGRQGIIRDTRRGSDFNDRPGPAPVGAGSLIGDPVPTGRYGNRDFTYDRNDRHGRSWDRGYSDWDRRRHYDRDDSFKVRGHVGFSFGYRYRNYYGYRGWYDNYCSPVIYRPVIYRPIYYYHQPAWYRPVYCGTPVIYDPYYEPVVYSYSCYAPGLSIVFDF